MKKYNKGFIQIPFLIVIIISILTASVSTGVVLYKNEKLPFITKKDNVIQPTSTPSPTPTQEPQSKVSEASESEEKTEEALIPTQAQTSVINDVFSSVTEQPTTTPIVSQENTAMTQQPQTYSTMPLGDISSYSEREQAMLADAYNEFLQTPNLQYMNHGQQDQLLFQIVEQYYVQYKHELEQEILLHQDYLEELQEVNDSYEQEIQSNPEIEAKLTELRQTLENIQNQPVAMNIIEGRKQRAYQDWVNNNLDIFA